MKKLLYLPLLVEGGAYEQRYLERAFRKKYDVQVFDFYNYSGNKTEELLRLVQTFRPDIIHCQFQGTRYVNPNVFAVIKATFGKIVCTQWTGDVRIDPIAEMLEYGQYMDITFVNSLTDVGNYKGKGLKDVRFMMNAMSIPEQVGKSSSSPTGITFCGGRYMTFPGSQTRINLIERFEKEFAHSMNIYGFGWQSPPNHLPWDKQTEAYQNSYIILGQNNIETMEGWFSDRVFIALASGRPFLCQYSTGLENFFTDMEQMVYWRTIDEAVEKARWLLANPKEAIRIGKSGQDKVIKEHNWDIRVGEFTRHWEGYL